MLYLYVAEKMVPKMTKNNKFYFNAVILTIWTILFLFSHTAVLLCAEGLKPESIEKESWNKPSPNVSEYAQGEVLVKFKDGANPQEILKGANLEVKNMQRIHSPSQATNKFKNNLKLERNKEGWFWFLNKKYKDVNNIPDEELFKAAYNEMNPTEKALYRTYKIQLPEGATVEETISRLKKDPNIEYAEPNYRVKIQLAPNDPYYNSSGSWGQTYDDLWGIKKIQCEQAWDISQGEGIVVAVIDTGVDYNHEDIAQNIWVNDDEIPDNGVDDDDNGYVDDYYGYDFAYGDNNPMDGNGHGTHVSGTIAAVGNNNLGIVGVAPKAKIMVVKGFDNSGSGSVSDMANCIEYAVNNGADILNNSWGTYGKSQLLEDAFNYAYSAGCVNVAGAGNDNTDVSNFTPANLSTVITVAASDHNDQRSVWNLGWNSASNYGVKIDVSAPGGGDPILAQSGSNLVYDILSNMPDNSDIAIERPYSKVSEGYYRLGGTSMACPHVSGLAALILSKPIKFTNEEVRHIIRRTAEDIGDNGWDFYTGYGRVNALAAVNDSTRLEAQITSPSCGTKTWERADILGTAAGSDFQYYTLEYGEGNNPSIWHTIVTEVRTPVTKGILYSGWDTSLVKDGKCSIRLLVSNGIVTSEERVALEVDNINIIYPENYSQTSYIEDSARGGDKIVITGRVASPSLGYYRVYYRERGTSIWSTEGITLLNNNGTLPVVDQPLAVWDTAQLNLTELKHYEIKLEVNTPANSSTEYANLILDPQFKSGWPRKINGSISKPEIVDLDGDGLQEIIVVAYPNQIYVFKSDGTLKEGWPVLVDAEQAVFNWYTPPVAGDIDGDKDLEIVIAEGIYPAKIHAFHHNGSCVNGWPIQTNAAFDSSLPVLADLDGMPGLEVVITGVVSLFAYTGNGVLLNGFPISSDNYLGKTLSVGDLDRDGANEIVTVSYGKITVFRNDGTVFPGWPIEHIKENSFNNGEYTSIFGKPVLGDIDGDGDLEIILGFQRDYCDSQGRSFYGGERVYIYHHTGQIANNWPIDVNDLMNPSVALADFNADGYLEIIINSERKGTYDPTQPGEYDSDGKVYLFDHRGNLQSGWPCILPYGGANPIIADIDNDSKADVIVPGYNNQGFWLYSGLITFFTQTGSATCTKEISKPIDYVTTVDIDKDGKLELIAKGSRNFVSDVFVWELEAPVDKNSMFWPTFQHDAQHTGCYTKPNSPPILNPIGNKTIKEGTLLQFTVSASDPDGDSIIYSAENLPDNAAFNSQTRQFNWTPGYTQAGIYQVTFTASDGELYHSQTITITVKDVNRAPVVAPIPLQRIKEGQSFSLDLSKYASDPDGDKLYFYMGGGNQSPSGVRLTPAGLLTWTPDYNQQGTHILNLAVIDILSHQNDHDYLRTPFQVRILVLSVNDHPSILFLKNYGTVIAWRGWDKEDKYNIKYSYKVDNGQWSEPSNITYIYISKLAQILNLSAGKHIFYLKAIDTKGAESVSKSVEFNVVINNTPPVIGLLRIEKNRYLIWQGTDIEDDTNIKYSYRIDGGAWSVPSTTQQLDIWKLPIKRGTHKFEVKAIDTKGAESAIKSIMFNKTI